MGLEKVMTGYQTHSDGSKVSFTYGIRAFDFFRGIMLDKRLRNPINVQFA